MFQPVNIALIGAGNRASTVYAPLWDDLRQWLRPVAVCDPVKAHADAYADHLDVPAFTSLRELAKAQIAEAALIVAPVELHHPIACYLMDHGIHCHSETSMCSLLAQANEMVASAAKNKVILRIAENFFRFPFDRIAKKIIDSGFLGPVHRITSFHDHTGYHNDSRWIKLLDAYPETVQAIYHTMPTAPHFEAAHRFHTSETFHAHFFWFPDAGSGSNRLVVDQAANIKGLLGRYPRPGYTEIDGARGTINRTASEQSNPKRLWLDEAEVRYCSDEALNTKAVADQLFPIEHISEDGNWIASRADLPIGRVEYSNPYLMHNIPADYNPRDYYGAAIMDHLVDFAKAVRGTAQSEYTDEDARMAMMMHVACRESAAQGGIPLKLPLTGELQSETEMRNALKAKYGVDPMDIEGMIEVSAPRP